MEDRTVIDEFVKHLQKHNYPSLKVDCRPDEEEEYQNLPSVDAIAGPFAIEHTSIDTLPNQRLNADWFSKLPKGLRKNSPINSRFI